MTTWTIVDDLSRGVDDRGEILNFYNPGEFHMGCLRPCDPHQKFWTLSKVSKITNEVNYDKQEKTYYPFS